MEAREILSEQLKYLYQLLQVNFRNRTTVKSWCITVWLAAIALTLTRRDTFLGSRAQLIIFGPVLLFWLLETIEGAKTRLLRKQAMEIEKRLAEGRFETKGTSECFVMSRYEAFGLREKLRAFIRSFFTSETIISFYGILAVTSAVLLWILSPNC